ncbi:hypothetical protein EHP00_311 [Ecytonucleospora hepatopenaei]|uniref:Uncharacterized protein n=1 Tax=Ecytonucleospora hepatopenaei TaxID=646526 RepID=A0A1W0E792_9MICR|nr:hypothetical protein EHP00_311 [Ecytonucleospora hepatopenaei]
MITTNLNSKLKRNISFHSSIFIGKNAIVFWMADLWQFKKYDKIAFYTTKNILIIFIVNLFLHVGYTWTLLNMDIKSYEQLAITSQCFLMLAISVGLQCMGTYLVNDLHVNYVLVVVLNILVFYEIYNVSSTSKKLGPISYKNITRFTSNAFLIDAWNKRKCLKTIRIGLIGFVFVYVAKTSLKSIMKNVCNNIIKINKYEMFTDFIVNIISVTLVLFLSINLDKESKTHRICIFILLWILIFLDIAGAYFEYTKNHIISTEYDFIHIFRVFFVIHAFFIAVKEYRTLGKGLKELERIHVNKTINKF